MNRMSGKLIRNMAKKQTKVGRGSGAGRDTPSGEVIRLYSVNGLWYTAIDSIGKRHGAMVLHRQRCNQEKGYG